MVGEEDGEREGCDLEGTRDLLFGRWKKKRRDDDDVIMEEEKTEKMIERV